MQLGLYIMQSDTHGRGRIKVDMSTKNIMCVRLWRIECCGNFIVSVVHKCYICSLQIEHAEREESVTARRFILKANYLN